MVANDCRHPEYHHRLFGHYYRVAAYGRDCGFFCIGAGCGVPAEFVPFGPILLLAMAIPFVLLNIVSIVGGVYALKKKRWELALAGSITAFVVNWVFGAAAVVFIGLSRSEFD